MTEMGQMIERLLGGLGVDPALWTDGSLPSVTPLTGEQVARVRVADAAVVDERLDRATAAFRSWRHVPPPRRGGCRGGRWGRCPGNR